MAMIRYLACGCEVTINADELRAGTWRKPCPVHGQEPNDATQYQQTMEAAPATAAAEQGGTPA